MTDPTREHNGSGYGGNGGGYGNGGSGGGGGGSNTPPEIEEL